MIIIPFFKASLLALFAIVLISNVMTQILPDTLLYKHNKAVQGTLWSFTAVHITDLHLGENSPNNDYGTIGWNDSIDNQTGCEATDILENVVGWINNNYITEKISIVLVTGDITDRGEKSGFIMAKNILDNLHVPYIIFPGNHDIWPRAGGNEASAPFGDSVFAEVLPLILCSSPNIWLCGKMAPD